MEAQLSFKLQTDETQNFSSHTKSERKKTDKNKQVIIESYQFNLLVFVVRLLMCSIDKTTFCDVIILI